MNTPSVTCPWGSFRVPAYPKLFDDITKRAVPGSAFRRHTC
jgi:hypothetical protein